MNGVREEKTFKNIKLVSAVSCDWCGKKIGDIHVNEGEPVGRFSGGYIRAYFGYGSDHDLLATELEWGEKTYDVCDDCWAKIKELKVKQ